MKNIISKIKALPIDIQKFLVSITAYSIILSFLLGLILISQFQAVDTSYDSGAESIVEETAHAEVIHDNESLFVEITGQVANPGVYEVKNNLRVVELFDIAGGVSSQADLEYLNKDIKLSELVTDGYKLYVPPRLVGTSSVAGSTIQNKISINNASISELESLPGVGPVMAQNIILGRPYASVDDLLNVSGIGESTISKLRELVSL